MDSVADILGKKEYKPPDDMEIIKNFIRSHFDAESNVKIKSGQIIIYVNSSALANSIRIQLPKLKETLNTKKRIVIYIDN